MRRPRVVECEFMLGYARTGFSELHHISPRGESAILLPGDHGGTSGAVREPEHSNEGEFMTRKRLHGSVGAALSSLMLLTACAGAVGDTEASAQGEGFEYGASQEEVDAVIEDLEPVTLVYQPSASSPDKTSAVTGLSFKEAVEERSGGKITLDIVWGQ